MYCAPKQLSVELHNMRSQRYAHQSFI